MSQFETVYTRRIRSKIKRLQQSAKNPILEISAENKKFRTSSQAEENLSHEAHQVTNMAPTGPNNIQSTSNINSPSNSGTIPTSNRFGILQDEFDDNPTTINTETTMDTSNGNNKDSAPKSSNGTNETKPPPIIITSKIQDYKQFHNEIENMLNGRKYQIDYQRNSTIIKTFNVNDFNILKQSLAQGKVECFTYTMKNEKQHKVVLKASPHMEPDEIKNYFKTQNITVTNCTKLQSRKQGVQSSSFLISTNNKDQIKQLTSTNEIEHTRLRWESFIKKNPVTQCWRCQEVGHGSSNCFRKPRCLKCAANHLTRDCAIKERTEDNKKKLKCCNCGGNHPANFRNCPYITDYLNKVVSNAKPLAHTNKNNKDTITNKTNFNINTQKFPSLGKYVRQNSNTVGTPFQTSTYAQATKNENNTNILSELYSLTNSNNILSLISLLKDLKQTAVMLETINDPLEKLELLMKLIEKHNI